MPSPDRNSKKQASAALFVWLFVSLFVVVLSALPFTTLFPELGDLGGPLLAVAAILCALSWCFFVFCGFAVVFGRKLAWVAKRIAILILLPFAGSLAAYEIYAATTTTGPDAAAAGRFVIYDFDGERLRPHWYEVTRNAEGWRSTRDYRPVRDDETLTFFIGDSFVFGAVGQDDMIDGILRRSYLGDNQVIYNFGQPGAGLEDYLTVARRYGRLDPDTVLVFLYVGNDIPTRRHSSHWPPSCPFCDRLRALANRVALLRRLGHHLEQRALISKVRPETLAALARAGIEPHLLNPAYLAWIFPTSPTHGLSGDFIADIADEFTNSRALQNTLQSIAQTFSGTNFCFVLIPFHLQVSQRYVDLEAPFDLPIEKQLGREAQDVLLDWAKQHGHCMVDLLPALEAEQAHSRELLFYPLDGHLRPAGNALVAKELHELGLLEAER